MRDKLHRMNYSTSDRPADSSSIRAFMRMIDPRVSLLNV